MTETETVHFNSQMCHDNDEREIRLPEPYCHDPLRNRIRGEVIQTGEKDKVTCERCLRKLYATPAWRD